MTRSIGKLKFDFMNSRLLLLLFAGLLSLSQLEINAQEDVFEVKKDGDKYRIEMNGKLFTTSVKSIPN